MTSVAEAFLRVRYARAERIVGRRIADEFLLVPIVGRGAEIDALFTLSRVGTFIWEQLDGEKTGEDVVSALLERFEVDRPRAELDYREFVEQLLSVGAVRANGPK